MNEGLYPEGLLTTREAAERLTRSTRTVLRYIASGALQSPGRMWQPDGPYLIYEWSVNDFLSKRRHDGRSRD